MMEDTQPRRSMQQVTAGSEMAVREGGGALPPGPPGKQKSGKHVQQQIGGKTTKTNSKMRDTLTQFSYPPQGARGDNYGPWPSKTP